MDYNHEKKETLSDCELNLKRMQVIQSDNPRYTNDSTKECLEQQKSQCSDLKLIEGM